jgi:hypothetical protein
MNEATFPPLQSDEKHWLFLRTQQDKLLLEALTSTKRFQKFERVCKDNTSVFGEPNSSRRKQVQNRWHYLQHLRKENFQRFTDLCHSQGVYIHPEEAGFQTPPPKPTTVLSMSHSSSSTSKALFHADDDTDVDEFVLNFKRPTMNPNGMLVLRSDNLVSERDMIDCVTIIKPLFDARDQSHIKAELFHDGTGFQVLEPCIPTYMVKDLVVMGCLEVEDNFEIALRAQHKVAATRTREHVRKTKFFFPEGIKCKVGKVPGVFKMKNQFRLIQVPDAGKKGSKIQQVLPYIVWRLIVDGEARTIEKQDSEDSDDYERAYQRMSKLNVTEAMKKNDASG